MDIQKVTGYTMLVVCYIVFSLFAIMGIVFYDEVSPWLALVAIIVMFRAHHHQPAVGGYLRPRPCTSVQPDA